MIPVRYSDRFQLYNDTPAYPYPMNFMQAPSPHHQVLVNYRGQTLLQGLSPVRGPFSFPVREPVISYPNQIEYVNIQENAPLSMSAYNVLDPYQRSFLRPRVNYGFYPSRYQMYQNCT